MRSEKLDSERAHQSYRLSDGTEVPGATTVLGVVDKSKPLMHWAWKLGREGKDYRRVVSRASDIGSIAHFMVECHLSGKRPDLSDYSELDIKKATNAFHLFLEFWERRSLKPVATEVQLVSEQHGYGGTLDLVARDGLGMIWLFDWKTSKAVYNSHRRQYAAYRLLWDENHKDSADKICEGRIVRIGKEGEGDFEIIDPGNTANYLNTFLAALELYRRLKDERSYEDGDF